LTEEYEATPIFFGYSSSPMAYGDTIIVCVGGKGHSIMAFNQNSGTVVWKKHDFANSHSSPVLINVDGEEQVVVLMAKEVVGLDPKTGDLKWSHPHTNPQKINVTLPIWGPDNVLFISSGYGGGSRALKLTRSGDKTNVEELWHQKKMQVHFGNAIRVGDVIYGSTGDNGPVFFAAIDVKDGKMVFRKRETMAKAMFLWADEKLIALDEDGQLLIGEPKKGDKVRILSRAKVFDTLSWTVPTLVGSRMYLRDQKTIKAIDLGKASKPTT
jgi:outer membrane protein assembly factor BamB